MTPFEAAQLQAANRAADAAEAAVAAGWAGALANLVVALVALVAPAFVWWLDRRSERRAQEAIWRIALMAYIGLRQFEIWVVQAVAKADELTADNPELSEIIDPAKFERDLATHARLLDLVSRPELGAEALADLAKLRTLIEDAHDLAQKLPQTSLRAVKARAQIGVPYRDFSVRLVDLGREGEALWELLAKRGYPETMRNVAREQARRAEQARR